MRRLWFSGSALAYHTKCLWFEPQQGHRQDFDLLASECVDPMCHLGREVMQSYSDGALNQGLVDLPCAKLSIKHGL